MGKINVMSDSLVGKIQAGEVVERPSSVVKELIENSIDAGSKNITIYLGLSGLESIKIIDDGEGMDSEDVLKAFIPHATSKIKTEYDLFRIMTLGFRGEAIASIAQVSDMTIISSQDGNSGYCCEYKFGKKIKEEPIHSNKGTTITVKQLFLNTPARLKYLKSEKSELSSILFFIEKIAIAHLDIRFNVYNNDKMVFSTSGSGKIVNLIGEIYGLDASKALLETNYVKDGYKAHLVFLKPEIYRANKLEITMVVNGRYVKNYNVTNATIEAFDTYLPIGKCPIAVLYFDIDPLLVDCNVHPNKVEIKLANESLITSDLKESIKNKLKEVTLIPKRSIDNYKYESYAKQTIFDTQEEPKLNEEIVYNKQTQDNINNTFYNFNYESNDSYVEDEIKEEPKTDTYSKPKDDIVIKESKKIPYMEYVGEIFGTYLIFQNSEGMYLVDQHAAAERYNFEYYYDLLGQDNLPKTDLLIPIILNFSKKECLYIEQNIESFEKIGFKLEPIGDTSYAIRGVPLWAKVDDIEEICYEILSKMIEENKVSVIYFRESIAKMISCKASIKANHSISKIEIESVIDNLNKCKNPYTCPHGRPTIIKLSIEEIEKMFERIQK
ncbi:MAG: DNA mismatch repair endonuclease MutL [Acholeplasmatales bacterium]|nr:DNA mismatch repair endonuclease MutL [Acholeplasmatales bacterium]